MRNQSVGHSIDLQRFWQMCSFAVGLFLGLFVSMSFGSHRLYEWSHHVIIYYRIRLDFQVFVQYCVLAGRLLLPPSDW